ncbi:hypothetical protein DPMN_153013 [Dreissena polymorpha]|uniref:Uncharacterized protein n=1 Tax=Dreissena polymorpha TaxID=45954 RepID=A0A9D4FIJ0_DREPO|nr:hypothetical protein DPMN_153013 [Dreissena polymorpha]
MLLNGLELCENGVIVEATCYELSSNFVDALNGVERERCFRTLSLLKIFFRSSRSTIKGSNNVLETEWTY